MQKRVNASHDLEWRIDGRAAEYHNKTITKLFKGNSLYGCYALAVTIFALGIIRDAMYAHPQTQCDIYPNAPLP